MELVQADAVGLQGLQAALAGEPQPVRIAVHYPGPARPRRPPLVATMTLSLAPRRSSAWRIRRSLWPMSSSSNSTR